MKVAKYLHSCLLVENEGKTFLIDPGIFTLQENVLDIKSIPQLDYLLITHEHPDHFSLELVKHILDAFPDVKILTNESVKTKLSDENILSGIVSNEIVTIEKAAHERLWDVEVPQNVAFTLFNKLTHPGDSLALTQTAGVLALPITAPWGSVTHAVETALQLKPKVIIPIHDWHWKDGVRKEMYRRLSNFFRQMGIDFRGLEAGETIEV